MPRKEGVLELLRNVEQGLDRGVPEVTDRANYPVWFTLAELDGLRAKVRDAREQLEALRLVSGGVNFYRHVLDVVLKGRKP